MEAAITKLEFTAIGCSGEDPDHVANELNCHTTHCKGFMTPKNCEYPQELILRLNGGSSRVTQIQFLSHQSHIASKIELYWGQGTSNCALEDVLFYRLGYFTLKSNVESNFMARELKMVHIDQEAEYLKFSIHSCYMNERNLYSQVGIMAIYLSGTRGHSDHTRDQLVTQERFLRASGPTLLSANLSSATLTKGKDEASDMQFDAKTSQRIREIQAAKSKAVADEDYDQAKRLKQMEEHLKNIGIQLTRLEVQKKEAVENEDYDLAKRLKNEIVRLEASSSNSNAKEAILPPMNPFPVEVSHSVRSSKDGQPASKGSKVSHRNRIPSPNGQSEVADMDRPLSAKPNGSYNLEPSEDEDDEDVKDTDTSTQNPHFKGIMDAENLPDPEEIPSSLRKESGDLIAILGAYLTRCYYSNVWNHRDAAIRKVTLELDDFIARSGGNTVQLIEVCCTLVQSGIGDRINQVAISAFRLLERVMPHASDLRREQLCRVLGNTAAQLVYKLGITQTKIRDEAAQCLVLLATTENVGVAFVASHLLKRSKKSIAVKMLQGRCQVLLTLLTIHVKTQKLSLIPESEYSFENISAFLEETNCYVHQSRDIRELAKEIMVALYLIVGDDVDSCLKVLRPKQLEEYHAAFRAAKGAKHAEKSPEKPSIKSIKHIPDDQEGEDEHSTENDLTCPFCDHSDTFASEELDHHFWASCPMLTPCKLCGQVIEIATLNDHLLLECERKNNHRECPRCGEAITSKFFEKHVSMEDCLPRPHPKQANRCPLCHEDITPSGKKGWKRHLLEDTCPKNPRT
uniref:Uncharacterized protein AlNc14C229G9261 n=1 Tax=Albugo laibachii Nc14 TaxID=890382 RepID=F0WSC1_9STRA|nr:conserved hypothetical protein [Albugo laibachii Nc14]CCA25878.1 conserved hypothetical protein [Albugo laibachii Nc14]|eukprot:CCA25878.1 conserved hypothetical protein [Albugo laibachii Nc14]